jgi:hypothetical protein
MTTENSNSPSVRCLLCRAASFCSLCFAISTLTATLLLTILFSVLNVPFGVKPLTVGHSLVFIFEKGAVPVLSMFGEMLRSLSPWGLIVFVIISVVLWGPSWIRETLSSSKWELPGGIKFDGTAVPSSFRRELSEAARIVDRANKELGEAYSSAHAFASQLRDRNNISSTVSELTSEIVQLIGDRCPSDFRLTIYVPDFIFSDRLYQFTDYYDRSGKQLPDSRVGRTFSIRYGIIGRVWRSGVSEIEGELISQLDKEQLGPDYSEEELERFIARRWGLSLDEAIHIKKYNSYGALKLNRAGKSVGVLFFDSKTTNAFCEPSERKDLETKLSKILEGSSLALKLLEISNEVAPWSGRIQIIRNS